MKPSKLIRLASARRGFAGSLLLVGGRGPGRGRALRSQGLTDYAGFGAALALDGGSAALGAAAVDSTDGSRLAGGGQMFEHDQGGSGSWREVAELTASDPGTLAPSSRLAIILEALEGIGNDGADPGA